MNVEFAWPLAFLLFLAVPALLLWEVWRAGSRPALRLSSLDAVRSAPKTWRVRFRGAPAVLRTLTLLLLIVALARPQIGQADALLPQQGIDAVLVLDTSPSMREERANQESRLDVAQEVLRDFVANRERDRLGLVAFRARSIVLSPLTLDYGAFQALVEQADDVALEEGTAIGLAVADALNLLRDSTARSRIIILLTDGENNQDEVEPAAAARLARALGIRVYTIGVTDTGGGFVDPRLTSIEMSLKTLADSTDGRFFQASDPETLAEVYETIDGLERSRLGQERFAAFDELAPYLLGGALALLAAEVLLSAFALRRLP